MKTRPMLYLLLALIPTLTSAQMPGVKFAVDWDGKTGQLLQLRGHDAQGLLKLTGTSAAPLADLRFTDGGREYSTSHGQLIGQVAQRTEQGNLVRTLTIIPCTASGERAPLQVQQTFTVYPEGAIFCDFTISVPAGSAAATVSQVELRSSFPSGQFPNLRWFWKRDWQGDLDLTRDKALDTPGYLRVMGASFSRGKVGYTNHWEMFVEKKLGLSGTPEQTMKCSVTPEQSGNKQFSWTLYSGAPLTLAPGFSYNNRWGMDLSGVRQRDNAIGQRIAHWQEGNAALMTFPSDSAIEAMANCGVTICILHLYWKAPGWGNNFTAFDEKEMARWVTNSHRRGIKCILYAIPIDKPGIDGINPESYGRYHCDGLYFDFGSVHFRGDRPGDAMAYYEGRDFPAMGFLNLTRHYRQTVGLDGIMIAHAGGAAPDALYCLNLNAYLPGEAGEQGGLLAKDLNEVYYHSGLAYAVCHPWCEYEPFQTRHAVANFCAIGAFPQVLFGRGTHQDNNYPRSIYEPARFAMPYWQMLRCLPMDKNTTMYNELTTVAAKADKPDLHCVAYRRAADYMLITVSNLGAPCSGTITLNRQLLQPANNLRLFKLSGKSIEQMWVEDLGLWKGSKLATGQMATDDYAAFLLVGSKSMADAQSRLQAVRTLIWQYRDKTPPSAVKGLQSTVKPGVVSLRWQPATDNSHVTTYRIYRADGTEAKKLITEADETTQYEDFTAPAGSEVTYSIAAVDVAGNEGPAATLKVTVLGQSVLHESTAAATPVQRISGRWSVSDGWCMQSTPQGPATEKGATYRLNGAKARFLRVYFTGGTGNNGCAHLVELQAKGLDGKIIQARKALSSGDDPGHPASDIMDGNTDKTRNGWWSDRNKGLPAWAGLEFGEPVSIAEVWVLTFWDGQRFYQYSVETSDDGQEWHPVAAAEGIQPLARALTTTEFTDGTISVTTLESAPERSGGGLLFRCTDGNNGYAFCLDDGWDGNARLSLLQNGKLKTLKAFFFPYSIFRPIPHLLQVQVKGDTITCFADQVKVFEVQDKTFTHGKVGLFSLTGGELRFRNLLVEEK